MARDDYDDDDLPSPPAPKVSILTFALIVLNLVAAAGFLALLVLDYQVRNEWSFAAFRNVVAVWGLPLQDEEEYLLGSLTNETRPRARLSPEQLKKAFRGKGSPDFDAVDEVIPVRVLPSQLTPEIKAKLFEGLGDPVGTPEEEIARLKTKVPGDIEEKAKAAVEKVKGKSDAEKQVIAQDVLLPRAWGTELVEGLHKLIAEKKGADLDAFLNEAVQRRIYADILAPLHLQRPGDLEDFKIEKSADQTYSLADLRTLLETRIDAAGKTTFTPEANFGKLAEQANGKRDAVDRRRGIATLLFTIAQARVPILNEKLYPEGVNRAQVVVGLYDLARAVPEYTRSIYTLNERILDALRADREGHEVMLKDTELRARTNGFVGKYAEEIDRLKQMVLDLKAAEARLTDLQKQRAGFQKVFDERTGQLKAAGEKLVAARKETFRSAQETRVLQDQLHEALLNLADVETDINRLEREIDRASGVTVRPQPKKGR